jgi:hypothetical protein
VLYRISAADLSRDRHASMRFCPRQHSRRCGSSAERGYCFPSEATLRRRRCCLLLAPLAEPLPELFETIVSVPARRDIPSCCRFASSKVECRMS